tara:strand:- start:5854 stop:6504 length:651 start_codon:yes stop_codon:yes gene_type:complete
MAKELPYFKFEPAEWMMGRITREPSNVQIAFLRVCCQFWRNSGDMTIEDASLECDEKDFDILIKKKFVLTQGDCISIKFLDIQLDEMAEVSKGRSKAAKVRWDKNNANALQLHKLALQKDADKIIGDENREEEKKVENKTKGFAPPTLLEVKEYFKEKGYSESSAIKAFNYYEEGNWKDSRGQKVKSWKQKMQGVWFKDENKIRANGKIKVNMFQS